MRTAGVDHRARDPHGRLVERRQLPAGRHRGRDLGDGIERAVGEWIDGLERLVELELGTVEVAEQRLWRAVVHVVAQLLGDLDLAGIRDRRTTLDHPEVELRDRWIDMRLERG